MEEREEMHAGKEKGGGRASDDIFNNHYYFVHFSFKRVSAKTGKEF